MIRLQSLCNMLTSFQGLERPQSTDDGYGLKA